MFFKNQRGVTLVEGILGGAITIGAAFTVMKMNDTMIKTNKTLENNNEMIVQIAEIRSVLGNSTACKNSFENLDATDSTGITTIRDNNNNIAFETNKQYGSTQIKIESMRINDQRDSVEVNPGSTGTTHLLLTFNRGTVNLGPKVLEKTIRLSVTTDGDSKITSYYANSSMIGDLWKPSTINPDNIFYNAGNVGIGTDNPTGALDITNDVGQKDIRIHKFGTGPKNAAAIAGRRARGLPGAPESVTDGDSLLTFVAKGHNGSDYSNLAGFMNFAVDGSVSSSSMPTKFALGTTKFGDTQPTDRLVIRSNGNVGLGTDNPTAALDITNDVG